MKKKNVTTGFSELRNRAEALLAETKDSVSAMSLADIKHLVHELDTYQIELELQNEDLRQSQIELEQARRRFSDLYDFAPMGYLTVTERGMIVGANLMAGEMLGVARAMLMDRALSAFVDPAYQDEYYKTRRMLLESGKAQSCELRMLRKGGDFFDVQCEWAVNSEMDGDSSQFRLCLVDISRQNILQKGKEEWEETFDAMPDIVTIQDKDLRIVRANKAAHQFFAVPYGEMIGRHCYEFFRGTTTACSECPLSKKIDNPEIYSTIIHHPLLKKTFQVSLSTILKDDGDVKYLVHVARDISQQKKLEEDLFQSHKMEAIGTLAGGIAHDFNNILGAILGYSEFIQQAVPADSQIGKDIDKVILSGKRAAELVRQILTFSRKTAKVREPLHPHLLVVEAIQMLRATLPATISIKETIDPDCGMILAHPTSVHQIVVNLCTNSLHAMDEGKGLLRVVLQRRTLSSAELDGETSLPPGDFIVLTVADSGHGIEGATIKRIFEPYFTTKEVGKGSGLGLALVHGIVQDCDGFMEVESIVGEGSTFSVYFPVVDAPPPAQPPLYVEKNGAARAVGSGRILVVDDEPLLVKINEKRLQGLGYQVTAVTDSREALFIFQSQPDSFDLLITDQTMPGLTGEELVKAVLEIKPSLPVILCTGHSDIFTRTKALSMGITKYVFKPLLGNELLDAVRAVLDVDKE